jgi:hypothetical protein
MGKNSQAEKWAEPWTRQDPNHPAPVLRKKAAIPEMNPIKPASKIASLWEPPIMDLARLWN